MRAAPTSGASLMTIHADSRTATPKTETALWVVSLGNYSATHFALPLRSLSSTQTAFVVETSVASENNRNLVLA